MESRAPHEEESRGGRVLPVELGFSLFVIGASCRRLQCGARDPLHQDVVFVVDVLLLVVNANVDWCLGFSAARIAFRR